MGQHLTTSADFESFCIQNGIHHLRSTPHHPATNGLAECSVQTFRQGLKKLTEGSLETRLARFLFSYWTTPQSTTGHSPAEILFGRPCEHSWISCSPTCMLRCRVSSSTWRPTTINMLDSIASALETRYLSVTMVRVSFGCQGSFQRLEVLCPMWWPWRMAEWCAAMWTFWSLVGHTHGKRLSLTLPLQIWRLLYPYSRLWLNPEPVVPEDTNPTTATDTDHDSHPSFGIPVDHVDHQTA